MLTEEVWFTLIRPHRMLKHVEQIANERRLRLLVVACQHQSFPHMSWRDQAALSAIERIADGVITEGDLAAVNGHYLQRFYSGPKNSITTVDMRFGLPVHRANESERIAQCALIRDIFGNPFRPATFAPEWRTDTTTALAAGIYESRDFSAMPILADALQDAGCDNDDILAHCRAASTPHVRGCWVVDLVLGKE